MWKVNLAKAYDSVDLGFHVIIDEEEIISYGMVRGGGGRWRGLEPPTLGQTWKSINATTDYSSKWILWQCT